jgi:hypothetical protein
MKILENNKCIVKAGRGAFRKARLLSIRNLITYGNNNCINVCVVSKRNKILYTVYVFVNQNITHGIMYENDFVKNRFRVSKLASDYMNRKNSGPFT